MITDEQVENAVDYIRDKAGDYANAKAERIFLEEFLGSKRAILFNEYRSAYDAPMAECEAHAKSHPQYIELLTGLKAAVDKEETIRWLMVAAQAKIEIYRTQCANQRGGY